MQFVPYLLSSVLLGALIFPFSSCTSIIQMSEILSHDKINSKMNFGKYLYAIM
jgi:hypothetical protein